MKATLLNKNRYKEIIILNRLKVLMHYSNPRGALACNNCGEQDADVLCLDHLNGDGYKHRKSVGSGSGFYHWVITNNYPPLFQVLCCNCNIKKERGEIIRRNGN